MPLKIKETKRQINPENYAGVKSKQELLDKLAKDKKFLNLFNKKIERFSKRTRQDILQDIFVYLIDKDERILLELNQKGQLFYFVWGILWTQTYSDSSKVYSNYIRNSPPAIVDEYEKIDLKDFTISDQQQINRNLIDASVRYAIEKYEKEGNTDIEKKIFIHYIKEKSADRMFSSNKLCKKYNKSSNIMREIIRRHKKIFFTYLLETKEEFYKKWNQKINP